MRSCRVNLPIIGSVGMEILGPQYTISGGISYSKESGEADPEFSVTLVDVSGDVGGSFNVGSMFGASISYWAKYSLSVIAIVHGRSVDFNVSHGWHGGGTSTIYTPAGNINIEFSLYDYQSPFAGGNSNIMNGGDKYANSSYYSSLFVLCFCWCWNCEFCGCWLLCQC